VSSIRLGKYTLTFRRSPLLMGVLNVTPDSFSDGGRFLAHRAAIEQAHKMAADGADIIDIGGESTRPGSDTVSASEELARVLPVIEARCAATTAGAASHLDRHAPAGGGRSRASSRCAMVNDVTAARDPRMVDVLRAYWQRYRADRMLGEPRTMQDDRSTRKSWAM
jgi:dihydropteroate synthase